VWLSSCADLPLKECCTPAPDDTCRFFAGFSLQLCSVDRDSLGCLLPDLLRGMIADMGAYQCCKPELRHGECGEWRGQVGSGRVCGLTFPSGFQAGSLNAISALWLARQGETRSEVS
jgi:hypothetical protein